MFRKLGIGLLCFAFVGCATLTAFELAVRNACTVLVADSDSALAQGFQLIPYVGSAINLANASCKTEASIQKLITSPTSVSWLNTLITTIESKGAVVPPPPVEVPSK